MTGATRRIISISKEELAELPTAEYHAGLKLIDRPDDVEAAVADLASSDIIGFDTETRPSFKRGLSYTVSLLQLSTREMCYLFRLNIIGLPQCLVDLLSDPGKLKVGLSIHDDFHNLAKLASFTPGGFIDLQTYVKDYMIADNSLTRLYGIVFGHRISKGQRLTNWEAETLSPAQQTYAALDALACIDLYDYISAGNFDPMASPYLKEVELPAPKPELSEDTDKAEQPKPRKPRTRKKPAEKAATAEKTTRTKSVTRKPRAKKTAVKAEELSGATATPEVKKKGKTRKEVKEKTVAEKPAARRRTASAKKSKKETETKSADSGNKDNES